VQLLSGPGYTTEALPIARFAAGSVHAIKSEAASAYPSPVRAEMLLPATVHQGVRPTHHGCASSLSSSCPTLSFPSHLRSSPYFPHTGIYSASCLQGAAPGYRGENLKQFQTSASDQGWGADGSISCLYTFPLLSGYVPCLTPLRLPFIIQRTAQLQRPLPLIIWVHASTVYRHLQYQKPADTRGRWIRIWRELGQWTAGSCGRRSW